MTGNILYNISDKYTKITFKLSDGSDLNYSTIRKLGFLEVWEDKKLREYSQRFGKTALESNLEPSEFISLVKGKKKSIRNTILDQGIISGVGNIYANEALFLTGINPRTMTNSLSEQQLENLLINLQKVMKLGIERGGSSIDRYKNIFGESGTQQDHFLVYGKKGQSCTHCKTGEISYEKYQGRGIYFCPNCQNYPKTTA
jgi:formamidopyrimidine-DNA glycosylase